MNKEQNTPVLAQEPINGNAPRTYTCAPHDDLTAIREALESSFALGNVTKGSRKNQILSAQLRQAARIIYKDNLLKQARNVLFDDAITAVKRQIIRDKVLLQMRNLSNRMHQGEQEAPNSFYQKLLVAAQHAEIDNISSVIKSRLQPRHANHCAKMDALTFAEFKKFAQDRLPHYQDRRPQNQAHQQSYNDRRPQHEDPRPAPVTGANAEPMGLRLPRLSNNELHPIYRNMTLNCLQEVPKFDVNEFNGSFRMSGAPQGCLSPPEEYEHRQQPSLARAVSRFPLDDQRRHLIRKANRLRRRLEAKGQNKASKSLLQRARPRIPFATEDHLRHKSPEQLRGWIYQLGTTGHK